MSVAATARPQGIEAPRLWPVLGVMLAAWIAWWQPFDLAFDKLTLGSPPLRAGAMVAMALAGTALGRRIGLTLEGPGPGHRVRDALGAAFAVAVCCSVFDWIWRSTLHPNYVETLRTAPLALRALVFSLRAFNESIIYRLFLGSLLISLLGLVWKAPDGRPAAGAFWTGFALSQTANAWINVTALAPLTPLVALHDGLRFVAPGVVWGWLFWRRGFVANEIASSSVHFIFQPMVVLGL